MIDRPQTTPTDRRQALMREQQAQARAREMEDQAKSYPTTDPRLCSVCGLPLLGVGAITCSAVHDDADFRLGKTRLESSTIASSTTATLLAYQVPLEHRLREVPQSLRLLLETDTSSSSTPVGYLCHEAADEITRLRAALTNIIALDAIPRADLGDAVGYAQEALGKL